MHFNLLSLLFSRFLWSSTKTHTVTVICIDLYFVFQSSGGGKSKLISRMAKMGQPMLPFQGAVPAQLEDSDEDPVRLYSSNAMHSFCFI